METKSLISYGKKTDMAMKTWVQVVKSYNKFANQEIKYFSEHNLTFIQFKVLEVLYHRGDLNIGAIINMFLLGFFVQFFNNVYCQLFNVSSPDVIPFSLPMKFVVLAIGILFVTLGCSLYITSDLGTGCYDALSIYMADVMSPSYPVCRIMTDVVCVLIGFITGGPLGIATIILMFGTGPLISTWNKLVSKPIVEKFA